MEQLPLEPSLTPATTRRQALLAFETVLAAAQERAAASVAKLQAGQARSQLSHAALHAAHAEQRQQGQAATQRRQAQQQGAPAAQRPGPVMCVLAAPDGQRLEVRRLQPGAEAAAANGTGAGQRASQPGLKRSQLGVARRQPDAPGLRSRFCYTAEEVQQEAEERERRDAEIQAVWAQRCEQAHVNWHSCVGPQL